MGLPTVQNVLDLPLMRAAEPEILAGAHGLDAGVRWVHVSELPDIGPLLRGNELLLSTGIAMPSAAADLRTYVLGLARARVSALVIELGRRFAELPRPLVSACESAHLPLVALCRPVPFVAVTEAVHSLVLDARATLADAADDFQDGLLDLALSGEGPDGIVEYLSRHLRLPVVLESTMHEVLSHASPTGMAADLLRDWEARSRLAQESRAGGTSGRERWLLNPVGTAGQLWGRLVVLGPSRVTADQKLAAQRAAAVITLVQRSRGTATTFSQARSRVLRSIVLEQPIALRDAHASAEALGIQLRHRRLALAVVVPPSGPGEEAPVDQLSERLFAAGLVGPDRPLVGSVSPGRVTAIIPFGLQEEPADAIGRFARVVCAEAAKLYGREQHIIVATADPVDQITAAPQAFSEASLVADAANAHRGAVGRRAGPGVRVVTLADCPLGVIMAASRRGVQADLIADRLLHPILVHDAVVHEPLLPVLRAFLRHVDNKTAAAAAAHLSRPAFYQRIAKAEGVLGLRLDDADVRAALQAALSLRDLPARAWD